MQAYDWLNGMKRLKQHLTRGLTAAHADAGTADAAVRQPPAGAAEELPQVFHFRRKPAPVAHAMAGER